MTNLKLINGFWCRPLRSNDRIRVTDYHFSGHYFESGMIGLRTTRSASDKAGPLGYRPTHEQDWHRRDLFLALRALHDETASYIKVNHLGPTHHNQSMIMAKDALALYPKVKL